MAFSDATMINAKMAAKKKAEEEAKKNVDMADEEQVCSYKNNQCQLEYLLIWPNCR